MAIELPYLFPFCVAMSEHVSLEELPEVARHIGHVESRQLRPLVIGCCPSFAKRSASPPLNSISALICLQGPLQVTRNVFLLLYSAFGMEMPKIRKKSVCYTSCAQLSITKYVCMYLLSSVGGGGVGGVGGG